MKNIFVLIKLLSVLSITISSCVTGEYDLAVTDLESNLSKNEMCTDYRDINVAKMGVSCNEPKTVGRYVGTWEATVHGSDFSKKFQIEITNNHEDYLINAKTNFGYSKEINSLSDEDLISPISFVLNVIGNTTELREPITVDNLTIFKVNLSIFEEGKPSKIQVGATINGKYVGFEGNIVKIES